MVEWFQREIKKDLDELDREKNKFISEIKKLKKTDLVEPKKEKLSLWKRIIKVLIG